MKICFIGDVHGQFINLEFIVNNVDADIFIQTGDFGLWTDCQDILPMKYRRELIKPVYFVEGNHDNHTFLERILKTNPDWQNGIELSENLIWMPRGSSKIIDGHRFFFCGGADSIDKNYRLELYPNTWWKGEAVTEDVLEYVNGHYDFVIAHDRPTFVSSRFGMTKYGAIGESSNVIEKIYGMMDNVHYWINGHWHLFQTLEANDTKFITLDMLPYDTCMKEKDIELNDFKYGQVNNKGNILVMTI